MPISNEEYQEYQTKIAERDLESLDSVIGALNTLSGVLEAAASDFSDIKSNMPTLAPGVATNNVRTTIDGVFNQVNSFVSQASYLKQNLEAQKAQLTATPPAAAPVYTPA